nr:UDP-2,3-diacylglucosamine diphosphatase [Fimbriiglobus sp.]
MITSDAIVISDLHLGSRVCQAWALVDFLESLHRRQVRTRRVILNGDVFDSIDFRRLKKSHWKVLSLLRKLSDEMEMVWVCGNHDGTAEIVSHLLGLQVVDEFVVDSGGRKVLFLHGHQFDQFIDRYPLATRLADHLYRLLQRMDRSHRFAKMAKRRSKTFLRSTEKIRAGAVGRAKEVGADAVCCGHTHLAVAFPDADVPYFNSGCWTETPSHYLTLTNGMVGLHAYDPTSAALSDTTLDLPIPVQPAAASSSTTGLLASTNNHNPKKK